VGRSPRIARRAIVVALVSTAHLGLYWLLSSGVFRASGPSNASRLAVFLIMPDDRRREITAGERVPPRSGAIVTPRVRPAIPGADPILEAPNPSSRDNGARVDWNAEAARAAEDAARGPAFTRSFGMPETSNAKPQAHEEFGWSHAHTHRVEPLSDGGFVLNITDRCAIVVVLLPMPFCRIGTIPVRGDLFERMHDPARPGDWKDAR
jgi:hypothetical protein